MRLRVAAFTACLGLAGCATLRSLTPTERAALREAAIVVAARVAIAVATGGMRF